MKTLTNTHPREISHHFPGILEKSKPQLEARMREASFAMDAAEKSGYGAGFPCYEYEANIYHLCSELLAK
jgi:hypothetical protein